MNFVTKDSGKRQNMGGGFVRDLDEGKLRFDLFPTNMFKRLAGLYTRGIEKYGEANRQQAKGSKAIKRFKQSAYRHFISWLDNEYDEDHGVAVAWNIFAYEWHRDRLMKEHGTIEFGMSYEDNVLYSETKQDGEKQNDICSPKETESTVKGLGSDNGEDQQG